jgi:hypothetical protein
VFSIEQLVFCVSNIDPIFGNQFAVITDPLLAPVDYRWGAKFGISRDKNKFRKLLFLYGNR